MKRNIFKHAAAALVVAAVAFAGCRKYDPVKVTGIKLKSATTVFVGATETLVPNVTPADAGNKAVTWESDNPSVASVNGGTVKGESAGIAVITATTADGGFEARCTVTVSEQQSSTVMPMTMTTAKAGEVVIYLAGTGTATIDWGDGSEPQAINLSAYEGRFIDSHKYTHVYSGTLARTITVSGYSITHMRCDNNDLTALDVSKNTVLTFLACNDNNLNSLDVSKNVALLSLYCSDNNLMSLDVSKNIVLIDLSCIGNNLTVLDVSKNIALRSLFCNDNNLNSLDVSKNIALRDLNCAANNLTTAMDVSNNTALQGLVCYGNNLIALDVSKNTELMELHCYNNNLTALDASKNTVLRNLKCQSNQFTAEGLNDLFGTLNGKAGYKNIYIMNNPGTAECDQSIATGKGWEVDTTSGFLSR
ncbi:MAG: Ig-like domain-containing protein [Bacteroidales bacterium]|jgi:hypothetical protein|nr:Ig-like domain-containing protein [Bacteroidales bacterium]